MIIQPKILERDITTGELVMVEITRCRQVTIDSWLQQNKSNPAELDGMLWALNHDIEQRLPEMSIPDRIILAIDLLRNFEAVY